MPVKHYYISVIYLVFPTKVLLISYIGIYFTIGASVNVLSLYW